MSPQPMGISGISNIWHAVGMRHGSRRRSAGAGGQIYEGFYLIFRLEEYIILVYKGAESIEKSRKVW